MAVRDTLAAALEARGYTTLTPVQEAVTNPEVEGQDLLVSAQTGSGKTVGFGIAIAPQLLPDGDHFERAGAPLALVIAPTRELALQVKRELSWLFEKAGAVLASTVGGMDMRDERRALSRGTHIVVATPGRLRDHIARGSIDLSALKAVVLDEADEMLDLGFREDLEFILSSTPPERQTLLFSATVPPAIVKLAKTYQNNAVRIATTSGASQHADIDYRAMSVAPRDGENAIINVLRYYEAPNAIVFCNTRAAVNRLTTRLSNRGFSVVALSGELSQNERTHALQAMRDGRARVCVATDVAARGIDLPNLELVIHADLPTNEDTLLHRSGRTGRAGRKGVSVMIVPNAVRRKAERLLSWAKLTAEWGEAPNAQAVSAKDEERMLAQEDWLAPALETDQGTIETLTQRFTTEQIAAAYLRLYRERHSAPEELAPVKDMGRRDVRADGRNDGRTDGRGQPREREERRPREAFGPSVWFSLDGGHAARAEPRRLLPMLCKVGGLSREDFGAIRIQPKASFIELRASALPGFLDAIGPDMTVEDGAQLTQLEGRPNLDKPAGRPDKPPFKSKGRGEPYKKGKRPQGNWGDKKAPYRSDKPSEPRPDYKGKPSAAKSPDERPQFDADAKRPAFDGEAKRPKKPKRPESGHDFAGGPKPPKGKASSKKNRARQAAAAAGKKNGATPGGANGAKKAKLKLKPRSKGKPND